LNGSVIALRFRNCQYRNVVSKLPVHCSERLRLRFGGFLHVWGIVPECFCVKQKGFFSAVSERSKTGNGLWCVLAVTGKRWLDNSHLPSPSWDACVFPPRLTSDGWVIRGILPFLRLMVFPFSLSIFLFQTLQKLFHRGNKGAPRFGSQGGRRAFFFLSCYLKNDSTLGEV
jgi:hypothetical protein